MALFDDGRLLVFASVAGLAAIARVAGSRSEDPLTAAEFGVLHDKMGLKMVESFAKRINVPTRKVLDAIWGTEQERGSRSPMLRSRTTDQGRTMVDQAFPLAVVLAHLNALERLYRSSHWQAVGPTSYSDHLLFERLYGALPAEIDQTGERLVGLTGQNRIVDADDLEPPVMALLERWTEIGDGAVDRARKAESMTITAIKRALVGADPATENMLQAIVDQHQTHLYLLQQRAS